jgi:hypothetical protein
MPAGSLPAGRFYSGKPAENRDFGKNSALGKKSVIADRQGGVLPGGVFNIAVRHFLAFHVPNRNRLLAAVVIRRFLFAGCSHICLQRAHAESVMQGLLCEVF